MRGVRDSADAAATAQPAARRGLAHRPGPRMPAGSTTACSQNRQLVGLRA